MLTKFDMKYIIMPIVVFCMIMLLLIVFIAIYANRNSIKEGRVHNSNQHHTEILKDNNTNHPVSGNTYNYPTTTSTDDEDSNNSYTPSQQEVGIEKKEVTW